MEDSEPALPVEPEPRVASVTVSPAHHRLRIDRFLHLAFPGLSRGEVVRRLAAGAVVVEGKVVRASTRFVKRGETVEVRALEVAAVPLELGHRLHQDDELLVLAKPAGLPTIRTPAGEEGAAEAAARLFHGGEMLHVVHRLDRETSGVLVLARTVAVARTLGSLFATRQVEKVYRARVAGVVVAPKPVVVDQPLSVAPASRTGRIIVTPSGRRARTVFAVLETRHRADETLLEVRPETGRRHQVRAHLAHAGHPVLGDVRYGGPPSTRVWLHALTIAFRFHKRDHRYEASADPAFAPTKPAQPAATVASGEGEA